MGSDASLKRRLGAAELAKVDFGHASAESEASRNSGLLRNGYSDPHDWHARVFRDRRYLILGRKGSGKTALGLHIQLRSQDRPDEFVTPLRASEVLRVAERGDDGEIDIVSVQWALMLHLFASIAVDEGWRGRSSAIADVLATLEGHGLLINDKLRRRPRAEQTISVKDPLLRAVEVSTKRGIQDLRSDVLGDLTLTRIRTIVTHEPSTSWHVLVIDGFEDEAIQRRDTRLALAHLMHAIAALNGAFIQANAKIIILALCRTDIFRRLPMADRNKLRQDAAVQLEWYSNEGLRPTTDLGMLANARAALSLGQPVEVHQRFFDWRYRNRPVHRQLVHLTRGTPRDLIVLLGELRREIIATGDLSGRVVSRAARAYAINYLWHEIEDEIETYLPEGAAGTALEALRRTGPSLSIDAFAESVPAGIDAVKLMRLLYDCGAIGQPGSQSIVFRYSSPVHEPEMSRPFVVHPGLTPALDDRI